MGTKLNKSTYKQLIKEDMELVEKYFPEHSLGKKHILDVLKESIGCYYPNDGKQHSNAPQSNELSLIVSGSLPTDLEIDTEFPVDNKWAIEDRTHAIGKRQGAKWMRDKVSKL